MRTRAMNMHQGEQVMQERLFSKTLLTLAAVLLMAVSLVVVGCDDDDDTDTTGEFNITLTAENGGMLVGETFRFDNGRIFDDRLDGDDIAVSFATTAAPDAVGFTLIDGGTAVGNVTFGSCTFNYLTSTFPATDGPQGGESRAFNFCSLLLDNCSNVAIGGSGICDGSLVVGDTDGELRNSRTEDINVEIDTNGEVIVNDVRTGIFVDTGTGGGT